MILVDSSVWIDYFWGTATPESDRLDAFLGESDLVVDNLVLTEVLPDFATDAAFRTALGLLSMLPFVRLDGREAAIEAARNARLLRTRGDGPQDDRHAHRHALHPDWHAPAIQ